MWVVVEMVRSGLVRLSKGMAAISMVFVMLMVVGVVIDVILRAANMAVPGLFELQILLMLSVTFLALPYVHIAEGHILIDVIFAILPERSKAWIEAANNLIIVIMLGIITWNSFPFAMKNLQRKTEMLGLPIGLMMVIVTIGCGIAALVVLTDFVGKLKKAIENKFWLGIIILILLPLIVFGMREWLTWIDASRQLAGVLIIVMMLVLSFLGMPLGYSLTVAAFSGLGKLASWQAAFSLAGSIPYAEVARVFMVVIPFFILMGSLCATSGIGGELMETAKKWMGRIPGSLAMATIGAGAMLGAVIGDSISACATMCKVALPEMKKAGYADSLSAGAVSAAGVMGIIIPPSGVMMIYAILTEASIGELFIAGIVPGIIIAIVLMVVIAIRVKMNPSLAPISESTTLREKLIATKGVWSMLVVFILSIGGLYAGFFTPVEAGAVGAMGALIIAIARRKLSRRDLKESLLSAAEVTGMLLFLFVGVGMLTSSMTLSRIPLSIAGTLADLPSWMILGSLLLFYFVVGYFMVAFGVIAMTIPILLPTLEMIGVDFVWFGVVVVLLTMIGQLTPPVGLAIFAVKATAGDTLSFKDIFKGVTFFWIPIIFVLILILIFPEIATFLPNLMKGG